MPGGEEGVFFLRGRERLSEKCRERRGRRSESEPRVAAFFFFSIPRQAKAWLRVFCACGLSLSISLAVERHDECTLASEGCQ